MQAIGIDLGTTSICGITIDIQSGKIIKSVTVNSDAFIYSSNEWERIQDTEKIISIAKDLVDSMINSETKAIGITGQMHGIVYSDKDGKAVSPIYTWQDARGNLEYKDTTYAKYLGSYAGYGNVTDFYNITNNLRPKTAVSYCTIHDYFAMVLCGLTSPIMHSSDAASFGCYDIKHNTFSYDCNAKVSTDFDIAGEYKGTPVSVAIGDNQASVFSTVADENNLLVNIGTGSQVSVISDIIKAGTNIEARPYFDGKYLIVGAALCGGRAYACLKDFFKAIIDAAGGNSNNIYAIMSDMIADMTETSLSVDTRFDGTRNNPSVRGSISGLTVDNFNPKNFVYGTLNGIINELYNMYKQMDTPKSGIIGSGNGIRKNKNLISIMEKVFGYKLKIPMHLEEAAFGAALYALIACGSFKSTSEAQKLIKYKENEND